MLGGHCWLSGAHRLFGIVPPCRLTNTSYGEISLCTFCLCHLGLKRWMTICKHWQAKILTEAPVGTLLRLLMHRFWDSWACLLFYLFCTCGTQQNKLISLPERWRIQTGIFSPIFFDTFGSRKKQCLFEILPIASSVPQPSQPVSCSLSLERQHGFVSCAQKEHFIVVNDAYGWRQVINKIDYT